MQNQIQTTSDKNQYTTITAEHPNYNPAPRDLNTMTLLHQLNNPIKWACKDKEKPLPRTKPTPAPKPAPVAVITPDDQQLLKRMLRDSYTIAEMGRITGYKITTIRRFLLGRA